MSILVTGASGFVGGALLQRLAADGAPVVALTRDAQTRIPGASRTVAVPTLDGGTDFTAALAGVDAVVHLAARVHVMQEQAADPLAAYRASNRDATLNLARQAAAAGVRRFVFVSSVKVNGEATAPGRPYTEADPPQPEDAYGLSKWEAEQGLMALAADGRLEVAIIRPPLVYGPGVRANFAALMRAVERGWPLPLGRVRNARSLVGVDNLVDLIATALRHPQAANQTFLASDGEDLSTPELVRRMACALGRPARLLPVPTGLLRVAARLAGRGTAVQRLCGNLQVDGGKARRLLGWQAPHTVDQELLRTAQWLQNHSR